MPGPVQSIPVRACGCRQLVVFSLLTGALLTSTACRDSGRSSRDHARNRGVASPDWEEFAGRSTAEPNGSTPLPPGWAEEFAFAEQQVEAAVKPRSNPYKELERTSPDGIILEPPRRQDRKTFSAGTTSQLPNDPLPWVQSDGEPPMKPSASRPEGSRSILSPSYLVMLVVFLAPIAILIPVLWFWHLLRGFRTPGGGRLKPVRTPRLH